MLTPLLSSLYPPEPPNLRAVGCGGGGRSSSREEVAMMSSTSGGSRRVGRPPPSTDHSEAHRINAKPCSCSCACSNKTKKKHPSPSASDHLPAPHWLNPPPHTRPQPHTSGTCRIIHAAPPRRAAAAHRHPTPHERGCSSSPAARPDIGQWAPISGRGRAVGRLAGCWAAPLTKREPSVSLRSHNDGASR